MNDLLKTAKADISIVEHIRQDLNLKRQGQNWVALCPFHNEKTPSFTVSESLKTYKCFGCGEHGDVVDWLRKYRNMDYQNALVYLGLAPKNLLPEQHPAKHAPEDKFPQFGGKPEAIYTYQNSDGKPILYAARFATTLIDGKVENKKRFQYAYWTVSKTWEYKNYPVPRPLYGLENIHLQGTIILVEGEKCRDALQKLIPDRAVMTWPGGGNAIDMVDWSPIKGRKYIYWPDNDEAGKKTIPVIAKHLGKISICRIPQCDEHGEVLPNGWDCDDAIKSGYTAKQIQEILTNTYDFEYTPEEGEESDEITLEQLESEGSDDVEFPKALLENIPGLVGKFYRWIMETSMRPQPIIALAAALPAVGVLYGHKVRTETNLRSNLYTLGVAPSGSGKDHARDCIKRLFKASGALDLIGGKPKSKPGVYKTLIDGYGKRLVLLDEIGRMFCVMNNKFTASHIAQVAEAYIELFSSAGGDFIGEEGANSDGKQPRVDIDQPCLCLYGTTIKEHLYDALSSKEAIDGFLSRWLLFETETPLIRPIEAEKSIEDIPDDIVNEIRYWQNLPVNPYAENGAHAVLEIKPKKIPFSKEAKKVRKAFEDLVFDMQESGDTITNALWNRASLHADKIALCCHEGEEISGEVMHWSVEVTKYCLNKLVSEISNNISDNEYEAMLKRVVEIIRKEKKITKTNLVRATQWLPIRTREDILSNLLESGRVQRLKDKTNAKAKKATEVFCYVPNSYLSRFK